MIRLIKQSRITRLYNSILLRYYGNLENPYIFALLRLHHSTLVFDVVYRSGANYRVTVRYKINGVNFLYLYRKTSVQNALLKFVLKHCKV